ncbi:hypothetical protein [Paracoccus sp. SSK6]|uniref:hypothetical protein n=1 Tax=Paracoccus sp. SSK6 TaxID=3143131 RepID=UPI003219883D
MTAVDHETLVAMLDRFKLTSIRDQLDTSEEQTRLEPQCCRRRAAFFRGVP